VKNADRIDIRVLANWPLTKAEDSIYYENIPLRLLTTKGYSRIV